jgi:flagellar basal-body rod protein FlgG
MRALYSAASGMAAQQIRLDDIANDLANVSTTGYKRSREAFQDLYYQAIAHGGAVSATVAGAAVAVPGPRLDVGTGARLAAIEKDFLQGSLVQTGNPLDLAIQGPGFFVLDGADGVPVYTRDGALFRDGDGNLIGSGGLRVTGGVQIPQDASDVRIQSDGSVEAVLPGDTLPTSLGRIELATFINPNGLRPLGGNLYAESLDSGRPLQVGSAEGQGSVQQGFLEQSNVDVAAELIGMIQTQRAYEMNSKVIQAADETLGIVASLRR